MGVTKIRILWWMSGYTFKDRIPNEDIRKYLGIVNLKEKMKENCLWWFWTCTKTEYEWTDFGARET